MSLKQTLISAVITLSAIGHVSADSAWYQDSALSAQFKKQISLDFWKFEFNLTSDVKNSSEYSSSGDHRLVVLTKRKVTNADGYTKNGFPYITVCSRCTVDGKSAQQIQVDMQASFWDLFLGFKKPKVLVENTPYTLQVLHNADMDGTSGALQNVKTFSAILNKFRSDYANNTVVLSSGDNYIPGPRFAASADESLNAILGVAGEGRGDMGFMNAMGYNASAVGNHDLDTGTKSFAGIINQQATATGLYAGAQFPYLSSNLDFTTDEHLKALVKADNQLAEDMANGLAKSTTIQVAGQTIGVVGATTPKLAQITNTGDITIKPENGDDIAALAAEIQKSVDALKAEGINKIILLAHMQQIAIEKQLAVLLNGVDIIIAGGSNTLLADANDKLRDGDEAADAYPLQLKAADNSPVLVVNTDGDYKYLGRLLSQFTVDGKIITERLDDKINGAYAADVKTLTALGNPQPIADVVTIADQLSSVLAARDGNILGKAAVYLDGRRGSVRTQETNLGNLTADANLWQAQQYDNTVQVSLKNGGGIRDDIGYFTYPAGSTNAEDLQFFPTAPNAAAGKTAGDISQFDIQGTLRFNNGLTLLTVTAEQLLALVEHSVAATADGATPGRFPQVAGMKFSFDPNKPANDRVQSLVIVDGEGNVTDTIAQNSVLVGDAARTIRMVTLGFIAKGGDGFPFPALDLASSNAVDLRKVGLAEGQSNFSAAGREQDALAEYLKVFYNTVPYTQAETSASLDERIQNLSVRSDSVIK